MTLSAILAFGGARTTHAQQPIPPSPSSPSQPQATIATLQDGATAITRAADQAISQRLAKLLGVLPGVLESQRTNTKLGWGELVIANRISQMTNTPFEQIVQEAQGKTWDVVAQAHNADVPKLLSEARFARGAIDIPAEPRDATQQQQQQPKQSDRHRRH